MHLRSVLHVLGNLLLLLAVMLVLPLVTAFVCDDGHLPHERYELLGFFAAIGAAGIAGAALRSVYEVDLARIGHREGAAIVTLSWVVFSLVGCLPFVITRTAPFTECFFETMSGFTTTGATIFAEVEILPRGLQLWRHETQWMGGMGIVVLSVAVLPMLGAGGYRMFKAEAPGGATFERNAPRIRDTAMVLWAFYLGLTLAEVLLLRWGGMTFFEAVCHGFTTMSTGGFSTSSASVGGWSSPMIQWTIIGFMFLAGGNFGIYQELLATRRLRALLDIELAVYVAITLLVGGLLFGVLQATGAVAGGAESTLRAAVFQTLTISTTTGYGTQDFDKWPDLLRLTLLLLMFVGGCAGSTAGGMKLVRFVIFAKAAFAELRRTINPRAVLVVRIGDRPLDRAIVSNVMSFMVMWLICFGLATYLLTAMGLDLLSATSAAVTNLGNVGPGLASVGPTANYAHVPTAGKWLLIFCQLLGRLELYSVLVLFLRRTWLR